jgi:hypothetical protein
MIFMPSSRATSVPGQRADLSTQPAQSLRRPVGADAEGAGSSW